MVLMVFGYLVEEESHFSLVLFDTLGVAFLGSLDDHDEL